MRLGVLCKALDGTVFFFVRQMKRTRKMDQVVIICQNTHTQAHFYLFVRVMINSSHCRKPLVFFCKMSFVFRGEWLERECCIFLKGFFYKSNKFLIVMNASWVGFSN